MSRCKLVEFLYSLVPLKAWRGFLVRSHIENCPGCQAGLASREVVESLLVKEIAVDVSRSLWTRVEAALRGEPARAGLEGRDIRPAAARRWAWAAAAVFVGALVISFLLFKDIRPVRVSADAARFELEYVRVGGQPANAVVYQPQGSDMIIVWAGTSQ